MKILNFGSMNIDYVYQVDHFIRPGETFSYNQTLGERTEKKGYKPAGAYMAGKTVETVGGGICQVSSTLYYTRVSLWCLQ